jgi:hypothetical protein
MTQPPDPARHEPSLDPPAGQQHIDSLDLAGANIVILNGQVDGHEVGELARIGARLVRVGHGASRCARCGNPTAVIYSAALYREPLCREHGYAGTWMTAAEQDRRIAQMKREGRPANAVVAFAMWSIDRIRG